jgi:DNA-binding NarL/FixJ family response regulator
VRALYVTTPAFPASLLIDLLAADRAMTVSIVACLAPQVALARLREEPFDVVLVQHAPPELDALEFVEAHRSTGADDAVVVVGRQPENLLAPLCYEVGADAYLVDSQTTARQLVWAIGRAIQWHALVRDNRRLVDLEHKRIRLEHGEAERLLEQQRGVLSGLQDLSRSNELKAPGEQLLPITSDAGSATSVPSSLVIGYRDLLRAYVIMGAGNLAAETTALVAALAEAGFSAPQVMQLHVFVLEETIRGLGGRSSRHVMARADLLVLEVMAQLVERYRTRQSTGADL